MKAIITVIGLSSATIGKPRQNIVIRLLGKPGRSATVYASRHARLDDAQYGQAPLIV